MFAFVYLLKKQLTKCVWLFPVYRWADLVNVVRVDEVCSFLRKRKADDVDGESVSKKQKKEDEKLEMKLKVGSQTF